jgi:hypothetical protein
MDQISKQRKQLKKQAQFIAQILKKNHLDILNKQMDMELDFNMELDDTYENDDNIFINYTSQNQSEAEKKESDENINYQQIIVQQRQRNYQQESILQAQSESIKQYKKREQYQYPAVIRFEYHPDAKQKGSAAIEFKWQHVEKRWIDSKNGYGVVATHRIPKNTVFIYVGEFIDFDTAQQRKIAGKGKYILQAGWKSI